MSAREVIGDAIQARDDDLGHVDACIVDDLVRETIKARAEYDSSPLRHQADETRRHEGLQRAILGGDA